ncbi:MAG: DUF4058 family protein [Candidatus Tectomicrobia bacterium]|nr:DUF4058 family protein [Candidatus Tectomicrobia bacterium]
MPMHDWTRVTAGTFHDMHNAWITELRNALNGGALPEGYYALGEQRSGDIGPDVLTLHEDTVPQPSPLSQTDDGSMIAVVDQPPHVSVALEASSDAAFYLAKRRTLVIYHATGDRIVALIEILSPGNKHSQRTLNTFIDKVMSALCEGFHVMVIDVFPPGSHDAHGIHSLIWESLTGNTWQAPSALPLTLASYRAKEPLTAYVEPISVGRVLPAMPLFLTPDHYINVPLESTYMAAWRGVPQRWRRVIEPS